MSVSIQREPACRVLAFSAHFKRLLGDSVKSYLTQWRMNLAYQRLKQNHEQLINLAQELGCESEAAFSRV
ncbi:hypothetical protein [Bermanella sp. R86510]|uniref:hypothetical protein n=1 Tax=unclassified Bermanella TaxID=2627862 RepID=UPI0037C4F293